MSGDAFSRAFGVSGDEPIAAAKVDSASSQEEDAFTRAFKAPPKKPEPEIVSPDTLEGAASSAMAPAVAEVGKAAAEGYRNTPALLTPAAREAVSAGGPVGRYVVNPLLDVAGAGLAGMNALFAGGQRIIEGTTSAAGVPALGRDITMGMQVLPAVAAGLPRPSEGAGNSLRAEAPAGPALTADVYPPRAEPMAPAPAFVPPEVALPPQRLATEPGAAPPAFMPLNPLAADQGGTPLNANALTAGRDAPPAANVPVTEDNQAWIRGLRNDVQSVIAENRAAGVPADLGSAATPAQLSQLTPGQMKAYRRVSEMKQILEPAGGPDSTIYVNGSEPTLAERSADPNISQQEVMFRQRKPDAFEGKNGRLTQNIQARVQHFDDLAGTDVQRQTLDAQQAEQAKADTARIMRTAGPADLQPTADLLNNALSDPRTLENDDVIKVLKPIRDALYDQDGNLKTNPMSVWGMHDNLMNKLTKAKDPLNASGAEKFAFDQMLAVKRSIDGVMNDATGGNFQSFLDNQASFFQQKNALKLLQDFRPKLTNQQGNINAPAFHKWLLDLAVRRGKPGVDPAMDIPDSTMNGLISLDSDLKRAGNIDLGKARGSSTNLYFEIARAMGLAGAHAIMAATPVGGVGNFVLQQGGNALASKLGMMRLNSGVARHLAAPPEGYTINPLSSTPPP